MSICSNLERPCYVSSPNLAWVPAMFQHRLWNKLPHTKDVTRWVVQAEVYNAILSSFCNVRWVDIWQQQGALQYFAPMSVSGNISNTGTHWLSFRSSAQAFFYFWEELGGHRRAGAEGWECLSADVFLSPWSVLLLQKFSKTIGNTKEMLGWPASYHSNHMLFKSAPSTEWLIA